MWPMFKTKMLIYQSRATLNMKFFCEITHILDKKEDARKVFVYGNDDSSFIPGP